MKLEVLAAVLAEIADHREMMEPVVGCGLLIGLASPGAFRVTRALRCQNLAPEAARLDDFEIDRGVVENVNRSLEREPTSILGFYRTSSEEVPTPSRSDLELIRSYSHSVLLVRGSGVGVDADLRAWFFDRSAAELSELTLDVLEPSVRNLLACPD
ncbi:MAG: hypothetical protein GEU90_08700 [Gemmatimonas sp.]|nr:hypothetical protein [Gemmatimonas sp.]